MYYTILLVAHTLLVLFLIGMILIQRSDSDGLGGLGGGGGGGNQFMTGRGAANFMTRTTAILAGAFMVTSMVLAVMANRMNSHSIIDSVHIEDTASPENSRNDAGKAETPAVEEKTVPAAPKPE